MKRKFQKLLALIMAMAMCLSLLQSTAFAVEDNGHTFEVQSVTFAEDGSYVATEKCVADGHTDTQEVKGKATDVKETAATCTEAATKVYSVQLADDNGTTKTWKSEAFKVGEALGHKDAEKKKVVVVKAPTCVETGLYREDTVCSVCGEVTKQGAEQVSEATGHTWKTETKEDGSATKTCTVCGTKVDVAAPHQHKAGTAVKENVIPADCETGKAGSYDSVTYCTVCGEEISREKVTVPAQHVAGKVVTDAKSVVNPTCTKEGSHVEITYCQNCGKEISRETKIDAKTAHSKSATPVYENDTATCQQAGTKDEVYKCVACGEELSRKTVASAQKAHDYAAPVKENVVEATCTKEGSFDSVIYCKVGGEEKSRVKTVVPKTAHSYQYAIVWDVDEDEDAVLYGQTIPEFKVVEKCADCGDVGDTIRYWADGKEDTSKYVAPAFACQAGSKTFTASYTYKNDQGKDVTITDSKEFAYYTDYKHSHHTLGAAKIEDKVEPTCTEDGSYNVVIRCTVCNEIISSTPYATGKTGHRIVTAAKKENVVKATYAKAGSYDLVVRCADCGEIISSEHVTVPKLTVNKSSISSVKNVKGKKATVKIKKASSVTGYQIQYSTSKKFTSATKKNTTATSKTLSGLKKGKKYYVRVRSYKTVSGKKYYSGWSAVKTVTIKK